MNEEVKDAYPAMERGISQLILDMIRLENMLREEIKRGEYNDNLIFLCEQMNTCCHLIDMKIGLIKQETY